MKIGTQTIGTLSRSDLSKLKGGVAAATTCWNCTYPNGQTLGCCGSSGGCFSWFYDTSGGQGGTCTVQKSS
jgi:hypothetical protein